MNDERQKMMQRRSRQALKGDRSFHPPASDRRIQAKGAMPSNEILPSARKPTFFLTGLA